MDIKNIIFPLKTAFNITTFQLSKLFPRDDNLWVFASGKNPNESQKALYNYIKIKYPKINCVWVVKYQRHLKYVEKFSPAYYYNSKKAMSYMLKAGVFITSYNWSGFVYMLHGGALFVRLTHWSTMFKKDTFDYIKRKFNNIRVLLEQLEGKQSDLLITNSDKEKKRFIKAKKGLVKDMVVTGKPINDMLFIKHIKKKWSNIKYNKVISYLPSHRFGKEVSDTEVLMYNRSDWNEKSMVEFLKEHNAIMLIKLHPTWAKRSKLIKKSRIIYLSADTDSMDILLDSDILITDYSTLFINYLLLNRPIIFTPYDLQHYEKVRGFYYDYNKTTPGPKETTFNGLLKRIQEYLKNPQKDAKQRLNSRKLFYKYLNDKNCERVTKEILKRIKYNPRNTTLF